MTYDFKKFEAVLKKWNLVLTEEQKNQFLTYYEMLVEKNKVMNLTSVTEFNEVVEKHFLDSISLWTIEDLSQRKKNKRKQIAPCDLISLCESKQLLVQFLK